MRRMKWMLALAVLAVAGVVWAAPPPDASWQKANGGMVRVTPLLFHTGDSLAVTNQDAYLDTARIIGAVKDTVHWVPIAGARSLRTWHNLRAVNDTAKVTVSMQVSPDTALGTDYTATLSTTFSFAFSAEIVDADTVVQKTWMTPAALADTTGDGITTADRGLIMAARWARWIYSGVVAATDTQWVGQDYMEITYEAVPEPADF